MKVIDVIKKCYMILVQSIIIKITIVETLKDPATEYE
jgi:hypothetical protein